MASPAAVLSVLVQAEGIARTTRQIDGLHGNLGKADKTVGRFGKNLEDTGKRGSKALSGLRSAAGLAGVAFGAAGLAAGVKTAVGEYQEAVKVGAQTNAVIKSTGGAANVTAKHVADLSTAISKKVGIDDEAIQSGSNLLLTFRGVRNEVGKGNDIFDQATQTITDMSVSLKQGLKPSAIQLGKALNDPIKGITALRRVGVSFTEQQQAQITAMVKAGNTLGAQKVILKELKSEFGGSAAAQATALDHLKVTALNLAEAAGSVLVPAFNKAATFLNTLINQMIEGKSTGGAIISVFKGFGAVLIGTVGFIRDLIQGFKDGNAGAILLTTAIAAGTIAFLAYKIAMVVSTVATIAMTAATTALDVALAVLTSPITLVVAGLVLLAAGVIYAYKHCETFRKIVDGMWVVLKVVAAWLVTAGVAAFNWLATAVKNAWGVVRTVTTAVWGALGPYLKGIFEVLKALISTYFLVYKTIIVGAWNAIKTVTGAAWAAIKFAILTPIREVRDALGGKDGIWAQLKDGAEKWWGKITSGVASFASGVASAVSGAFEGVVNKVIDFVNTIIDVVNKIPGVPNIKKIGHIGGHGTPHPDAQSNLGGSGHLARGGPIFGGKMNGDSVPAMLERGEYVLNRQAVQHVGRGNLDQLNFGMAPRYALGGAVKGVLHEAGKIGSGILHTASGFIGKLPGVGDLPGWIQGLGSYALGKVKDWITGKVKALIPSSSGGSGGPVPSGSARNWLTQALKITGHFSAANLSALFGRMMQESGGNPHAINLWDINAQQGHPSKGLLQTIDSTFNSYKLPGHGDIWNPIDNAIAAIRYMFAGYGHIVGPSGTGYAKGGMVGGQALPFLGSYHTGGIAPREGLAHVQAGERMTPAGQGGVSVNIAHAEFASGIDVNSFAAKVGWRVATA